MGYFPGETLLPAVEGVNSNGFFEDQQVVDLNDALYSALGRDWRWAGMLPADWVSRPELDGLRLQVRELIQQRANQPLWLLKDPRLCELFPLWREELERAGHTPSVILSYRSVAAASASLERRDNLAGAISETLWSQLWLSAERSSRGLPRYVVHYDRLVQSPKESLAAVVEWLALPPDQALFERACDSISAPQRHHDAAVLPAPSLKLAAAIDELFSTFPDGPDANDSGVPATLDALYLRAKDASDVLQPTLDAQTSEARSLETHLAEALLQLNAQREATQTYEDNASLSADAARQQYDALKEAVSQIKEQESQLNEQRQQLADLQSALDHSERERNLYLERATRVLGDSVLPPAPEGEAPVLINHYSGVIDLRVENNAHTRVVRYLREHLPTLSSDEGERPRRVLEVGCSEGYFGAALKDQGFEVWGIETHPTAADTALAVLDRVYRDSIEAFLLEEELADERFDAIVFGDVLEHLLNPARVLRACASRLTQDGFIAASVPNVAHRRIRMMLLEGRWDYTATGIMDRTHLHFFTRDNLIDLFSSAALSVERLSGVNVPDSFVEARVSPSTEREFARHISDPEQDVFQFVALAKPSEDAQRTNERYRLHSQRRILLLPPTSESSLYAIRLGEPLKRYSELFGGETRIGAWGAPDPADVDWADTVVLQREASVEQLELVERLQAQGKQVVFDIDDYLLDVPEYLSVYDHCVAMRPTLEAMLSRVDAVSASTGLLAERLRHLNERVFVTPNYAWNSHPPIEHLDAAVGQPAESSEKVRIIVASSDTVRVDFLVDALQQIQANNSVELVGIGPPGDYLRSVGLEIETAPLMSHEEFKAYIASRSNTIALIPLDENDFNACKSAIKWMDYALAGVPCVCSAVEPYVGVIEPKSSALLCPAETQAWVAAVQRLLDHPEQRRGLAALALEQVRHQHTLNHCAEAWQTMLQAIRPNLAEYPDSQRSRLDSTSGAAQRVDAAACESQAIDVETRSAGQLARGTMRHVFRPASWSRLVTLYREEGVRGVAARWKTVF